MSFPTQPALVHYGTWDDQTRKHPALKWMESYTKECVDGRLWDKGVPVTEWHTSDWALQRSTGQVIEGGEPAWKALAETYAPFESHLHDPEFAITWETEKGWEMTGMAKVYYNLKAPGNDAKTKDTAGKEWDGVTPGMFRFWYMKDSKGGIKLGRTEIYSDPSAPMVQMLKRGMIKPEDLTK